MAIAMKRPIPVDLEPKRKNRWMIQFPVDMGFEEWMVQTSSRPNLRIDETEIPYQNTSTWVAGRSVWEQLEVKFIDSIGPSSAAAVWAWVMQHIDHGTGTMGYATQYKKNLTLFMLDPAGVPIETWKIYGAFITAANWNDLDMSSSDLADVSITLRYDRAVLEQE